MCCGSTLLRLNSHQQDLTACRGAPTGSADLGKNDCYVTSITLYLLNQLFAATATPAPINIVPAPRLSKRLLRGSSKKERALLAE